MWAAFLNSFLLIQFYFYQVGTRMAHSRSAAIISMQMLDELEKKMFMGWRRPQHSRNGIRPDGTKRTVNV
jgi:hypothetical protein